MSYNENLRYNKLKKVISIVISFKNESLIKLLKTITFYELDTNGQSEISN